MPTAEERQRERRQARVARYSRAVRRMKVLLPLGAILLIGMIFMFSRDRPAVFDAEQAAEMAALGAGLRLDNPRFAGVTDDGDPFVITAEWALPEKTTISLTGRRLTEPSRHAQIWPSRRSSASSSVPS